MTIFVTVGTGQFDKLIKEIDKIANKIRERIICQIGTGNYEPKNCQFFRFKVPLTPYYKKARLIITHGGAGTIYELLSMHKKLIGVANLDRTDVHQQEILSILSKKKYLIWCKNVNQIAKAIKQSTKFKFKRYKQPECKIADKINDFLTS